MRGIITLRDCIVSHFYVQPIVGSPHWTDIDWREWHSKREKIEQYALRVLRRCKWNWTNRNGNWECFKWVRYWVCGYAYALCVDRHNGHANATQWWVECFWFQIHFSKWVNPTTHDDVWHIFPFIFDSSLLLLMLFIIISQLSLTWIRWIIICVEWN